MPINHSETKFFSLLAKREAKHPAISFDEITVDEFRATGSVLLEHADEKEQVATEDYFITARDGYQIPIRIFNSDIQTPGPIFIMFPGGGYVMNTFEVSSIACSRIAKFSRQKIILVNYRLVPENSMPTPINDAYDVTEYIATHPDQFQLDPTMLSIGGFSAGAHCAAVITYLSQHSKQINIHQQILLNGVYSPLLTERSYAEYEIQDLMVSREAVSYIYQLWGVTDDQLYSPIYSPFHAKDMTQLPKTTILVGEFDGMRSDSEAYFHKLQNSGCQVSKRVLSGQCHHTLLLHGAMTEEEDPAKEIAKILLNQ